MDISDFIGAAKTFHVIGIKVTKDGDLINEWYSEPECRRNIYSATKSFTSCAVGFAVQEGLLSLDEKLTDAFPEDLPDVIDDNLKMATVRAMLRSPSSESRSAARALRMSWPSWRRVVAVVLFVIVWSRFPVQCSILLRPNPAL